MLSESAMCLVLDQDKLARDSSVISGGILTGASALGSTLIERLNDAGMVIKISNN